MSSISRPPHTRWRRGCCSRACCRRSRRRCDRRRSSDRRRAGDAVRRRGRAAAPRRDPGCRVTARLRPTQGLATAGGHPVVGPDRGARASGAGLAQSDPHRGHDRPARMGVAGQRQPRRRVGARHRRDLGAAVRGHDRRVVRLATPRPHGGPRARRRDGAVRRLGGRLLVRADRQLLQAVPSDARAVAGEPGRARRGGHSRPGRCWAGGGRRGSGSTSWESLQSTAGGADLEAIRRSDAIGLALGDAGDRGGAAGGPASCGSVIVAAHGGRRSPTCAARAVHAVLERPAGCPRRPVRRCRRRRVPAPAG